jgi:hypothetical protein
MGHHGLQELINLLGGGGFVGNGHESQLLAISSWPLAQID